MSFRTASSKARNYDATLPIEDWAKGLGRVLSKRRKSAVGKQPRLDTPAEEIPEVPTLKPLGYSAVVSSAPRSASFSNTKSTAPSKSTMPHIEDWRQAVPQRKPAIKPRNPLRPSTSAGSSATPSILNDYGTQHSPPIGTPAMRTDRNSVSDSEPSTPNSFFQSRLDKLVDNSSRIRVASQDLSHNVSPLSSRNASHDRLDLAAAMMSVESMSLRSMFFGASDGPQGRPRSLSSASDKSAIPEPLVISGNSPRARPMSIASSNGSFMTANESAIEDEEEEVEEEEIVAAAVDGTAIRRSINEASAEPSVTAATRLLQEVYGQPVYPARNESLTVITQDVTTDKRFSFVPNATDMGIDEDYSEQEDVHDDNVYVPHAIPRAESDLDTYRRETAVANGVFQSEEQQVPDEGSLADILLQVATSSPYASEASEDGGSDADVSSQSDGPAISIPDQQDSGSEKDVSPVESNSTGTALSVGSMSIRECRRVRPARHYKMINGVIVEYEPWRVPGAFDLARYTSPSAASSDRESQPLRSDRGFQRSGSFMRSKESRWTYTGPDVGVSA